MSTLFDLSGKVAVVTGGSSGLGLGFARGIVKQGGTVVLWARVRERLESAKAALETLGGHVSIRQVDVSDEQGVIDGFAAAISERGRVDCVFANAGFSAPVPSVLDLDSKTLREMLETSLYGAFFTLREGARHMVARAKAGDPGGSLVACGSLALYYGMVGGAHYAAAKAGIAAITRAMAVEFAPYRIRANILAAGYFKTELIAGMRDLPQIEARIAASTPMRRNGYPDDVEGIAAYLASDASGFHTGDTIVVDGGRLISM